MSPLTFLPLAVEGARRIGRDVLVVLRAALAPFILAFAAAFLAGLDLPGGRIVALVAGALALGMFSTAWQRFLALGEAPKEPVHARLGKTEFLTAVWMQALGGFALVPLILGNMLDTRLGGTMPMLPLALQQTFLLLAGMMFLIIPHFALAPSAASPSTAPPSAQVGDKPRPHLEAVVRAGGIGVGAGLVLAMLPYALATTLLDAAWPVDPDQPVQLQVARILVAQILSFIDIALTGGYLALAYKTLAEKIAAAPSA
ncbi:MAG: hypothetical protein HY985_15335 [Magnetospirillum sp.]|nr:hypothetical protein [Magnetospirillum sp.]